MNVAWLGELAHAYWTVSKVGGTWLIILYCNSRILLFAGVEQGAWHFNLHNNTLWNGFNLTLFGCFLRKKKQHQQKTNKLMVYYQLNWYLHSSVQAASTSEAINKWYQRKASTHSVLTVFDRAKCRRPVVLPPPSHRPDRIIWKPTLLCGETPCQRLKRCVWLLLPEEAFCQIAFLEKCQ